MKENVRVRITGIHSRPGERTEKVVTESEGSYILTNTAHEIRFSEKNEEAAETESLLRVSGNTMELIRKGAYETSMYFEKGKEHVTPYRTPYGVMNMTIKTVEMAFVKNNDRILASVEYILSMEGQEVSQTLLQIEVKER